MNNLLIWASFPIPIKIIDQQEEVSVKGTNNRYENRTRIENSVPSYNWETSYTNFENYLDEHKNRYIIYIAFFRLTLKNLYNQLLYISWGGQ